MTYRYVHDYEDLLMAERHLTEPTEDLAQVWFDERHSPLRHELSAAKLTEEFVKYSSEGAAFLYESDCGGGGGVTGVYALGWMEPRAFLREVVKLCRVEEGSARWYKLNSPPEHQWSYLEFGGTSWLLGSGRGEGSIPTTYAEIRMDW